MVIDKKTTLLGSALLMLSMTAGCTPQNDSQNEAAQDTSYAQPETAPEATVDSEMRSAALPDFDHFSEEDMHNLRRDILRQIGTPIASDPSQCRVVPFGAKPCGGPERYVLYSTENTDAEHIETMIAHYNELAALWNEREGLVSDCAVVPEMTATVVSGVCVPVESATQ